MDYMQGFPLAFGNAIEIVGHSSTLASGIFITRVNLASGNLYYMGEYHLHATLLVSECFQR